MKFISEEQIDHTASYIGNLDDYESLLLSLSESQPALVAYLYADSFQAFSEAEQQLFLFMALVIWKSIDENYEALPEVSESDISMLEEKNWEILHGAGKGDFRERLTPFFEGYAQEDLLAFVEDSVTPDEDSMVTEEGKEYLFVSMKTIIDSLAAAIEMGKVN